jgi:hypothetical protein
MLTYLIQIIRKITAFRTKKQDRLDAIKSKIAEKHNEMLSIIAKHRQTDNNNEEVLQQTYLHEELVDAVIEEEVYIRSQICCINEVNEPVEFAENLYEKMLVLPKFNELKQMT